MFLLCALDLGAPPARAANNRSAPGRRGRPTERLTHFLHHAVTQLTLRSAGSRSLVVRSELDKAIGMVLGFRRGSSQWSCSGGNAGLEATSTSPDDTATTTISRANTNDARL